MHRCADCRSFLRLNCVSDGPQYFCTSDPAKTLTPPIEWLPGPHARSCQFFTVADNADVLRQPGPGSLSTQERYFAEPEMFMPVKAAAHLLGVAESTLYNMAQDGRLESVRMGKRGRIFVFRPALVKLIVPTDAG